MATSKKRREYSNVAHWKAFGKFIDQYSHTEGAMHLYLVYRAKLAPKIGNAVFAGTRVAEAISVVRRINIVETGQDKLPPDLEDIFVHLAGLNTARNDLVHYGASDFGMEYRFVMNWMRAHSDASFKAVPIELATLREMTKDAEKVSVSLYWQMSTPKNREIIEKGKALHRPWLYKPPQPLRRKAQKPGEKSYPQRIAELARPSRG